MAEKKFTCDVLLVLDEKIGRGAIIKLQVVRWNKYSPVLEKREYYQKDDEKKLITGKAKGFNYEDFQIIVDNMDKIQKILEKDFKDKR